MKDNAGSKKMDERKRAALEAAGWKVGTVQELLELSDEEMAAIEAAQRTEGGGEEER